MSYSVAIDGPAGAGKSTIAKSIAKKMKFVYVDTGAMYRAMGLYFLQNKIGMEETDKIDKACSNIVISIEYKEGEQQIYLNGENVTGFIRTEEVGKMASACAVNRQVRLKLVDLQRELAGKTDVIMDGRDIGTYVLPDADVKIYLTASSKERARRRWTELSEKGISCDIDEIEKDIISRDRQDENRDFAPLKQADDAILVDSSYLTIEEVADKIIKIFEEKINSLKE